MAWIWLKFYSTFFFTILRVYFYLDPVGEDVSVVGAGGEVDEGGHDDEAQDDRRDGHPVGQPVNLEKYIQNILKRSIKILNSQY